MPNILNIPEVVSKETVMQEIVSFTVTFPNNIPGGSVEENIMNKIQHSTVRCVINDYDEDGKLNKSGVCTIKLFDEEGNFVVGNSEMYANIKTELYSALQGSGHLKSGRIE